jgi:hypothetical protein
MLQTECFLYKQLLVFFLLCSPPRKENPGYAPAVNLPFYDLPQDKKKSLFRENRYIEVSQFNIQNSSILYPYLN